MRLGLGDGEHGGGEGEVSRGAVRRRVHHAVQKIDSRGRPWASARTSAAVTVGAKPRGHRGDGDGGGRLRDGEVGEHADQVPAPEGRSGRADLGVHARRHLRTVDGFDLGPPGRRHGRGGEGDRVARGPERLRSQGACVDGIEQPGHEQLLVVADRLVAGQAGRPQRREIGRTHHAVPHAALGGAGEPDRDIASDDELVAGQHTTRGERPPLHGRGGRPVAGGALQPEDRLLAGPGAPWPRSAREVPTGPASAYALGPAAAADDRETSSAWSHSRCARGRRGPDHGAPCARLTRCPRSWVCCRSSSAPWRSSSTPARSARWCAASA